MKKQLIFILTCLIGCFSVPAQAWEFKLELDKLDKTSVLVGAAAGAVVGYATKYFMDQYDPYVLYGKAVEVKNEVISDPLFARRNSDINSLKTFMHENYYSFINKFFRWESSYCLQAVHRLFKLHTKLERSYASLEWILRKYSNPDHLELTYQCTTLCSEFKRLSNELKRLARRIVCTKQWAYEVNFNGACEKFDEKKSKVTLGRGYKGYVESIEWSAELVGCKVEKLYDTSLRLVRRTYPSDHYTFENSYPELSGCVITFPRDFASLLVN